MLFRQLRRYSMLNVPRKVKVVEVGPRDGLQNEKEIIPAEDKIKFIDLLSDTGLSVVEATSFVSPKWVPQFADAKKVFEGIAKKPGVSYPVLVPNMKGLESALSVGAKEIAVFTTASEAFALKNTNCSVKDSVKTITEMIQVAIKHQVRIRAYLSCVLGCPYEGDVPFEKTAELAKQLHALGCYEVSLGDTTGVGTPAKTKRLLKEVSQHVPVDQLAVHFHDTYGQALPNILVALESGVSVVDSSVSGLGGCPYAPGASGNVATEDVVYMLHGMGIETGVNLDKLIAAGQFICGKLEHESRSKVATARGRLSPS